MKNHEYYFDLTRNKHTAAWTMLLHAANLPPVTHELPSQPTRAEVTAFLRLQRLPANSLLWTDNDARYASAIRAFARETDILHKTFAPGQARATGRVECLGQAAQPMPTLYFDASKLVGIYASEESVVIILSNGHGFHEMLLPRNLQLDQTISDLIAAKQKAA